MTVHLVSFTISFIFSDLYDQIRSHIVLFDLITSHKL